MQLMGGRFRNLMPSSLLHPGACAVESLPAPGSEYASQMAKGELRRLFKRCACVHPFCAMKAWRGVGVCGTVTCCLSTPEMQVCRAVHVCCCLAFLPDVDGITGTAAITVGGARARSLGTIFRQTSCCMGQAGHGRPSSRSLPAWASQSPRPKRSP